MKQSTPKDNLEHGVHQLYKIVAEVFLFKAEAMSPLDTNQAFVYIWYIWRFVGIHPYAELKWLYHIYAILINLIASVVSPIFVFMNIFFLGDVGMIMHNLQASITLIISSLKQFVIFLKISDLHRVKVHLEKLDKRASLNQEEVDYMDKVVKQCRLMTLGIQLVFVFSLLSHAMLGWFKKRLVLEGWFPLDWTSSIAYYWIAFVFQFLTVGFQIVQNAASDAYPPAYMNVLKGHIYILCMRVARIGKDPSTTLEDNYVELKACIDDHKKLISFFETIKPVISQTVLIQFLVTAFILCITVVYFLIFNRQVDQLIISIIYMLAMLLQVFPVCYFGNALTWETDQLTNAIYNCNWIDQSKKFRKSIIIFMQRSQKTNVILAGGLATISLQTFISIIRFSFSMFTVLSQMQ